MADYGIITIGGGLGGAALAKAMAERGARVLVLAQDPTALPDHMFSGPDLPIEGAIATIYAS